MALKVIMLRRTIERKRSELEALQAGDAEFLRREAELETAIGEAETDEQQAAVAAEVETFEAERDAHNAARDALAAEIEALENELSEAERSAPAPENRSVQRTEERRMNPMPMTDINIRELPLSTRAFDALPLERRQAIIAQDDVKTFLGQLRSFKGQTRAVSGADLLVPTVMLDLIAENRFRYSKLLRRVRMRNLRGSGKQPVAGLIPPAVWTGACKRLNEITLVFNEVSLENYKNAAVVVVCNSDLEDADMDLAAFIVEAISESLGLSDDMAILYGKGAAYNMPLGVVTRLAQTSQPESYPVNAPTWVDLHTTNVLTINGPSLTGAAFWEALNTATGNTFTRYSRGDLSWAMNSKTYNYLRGKAIATSVTGEWVAIIGGSLPIISGQIDVLEFMPDYDIVGGYFDLYLWGQRRGIVIGMDEMGLTNRLNDQTVFFGKERADGMPVIPGAFVAINIYNQSPTTTILFPSDDANTPTGLIMNTAAASVEGTGTVQLKAIALPYGIEIDAADITWDSATKAKATVSSTGLVTGVTAGSSVITATYNGLTAQCTVTVT